MLERRSLVLINNEPTFRWTVSRMLEDRGYTVAAHDRTPHVIEHVRQIRPGAVLLEASYGSAITATAIVERLRADRHLRYTPIIVCSPDGKFLHSYGEFLRGQGCVVLGRPFDGERLIDVVDRAVALATVPSDRLLVPAAHQPLW
jgi:DNA-binding NtrC family response regulator